MMTAAVVSFEPLTGKDAVACQRQHPRGEGLPARSTRPPSHDRIHQADVVRMRVEHGKSLVHCHREISRPSAQERTLQPCAGVRRRGPTDRLNTHSPLASGDDGRTSRLDCCGPMTEPSACKVAPPSAMPSATPARIVGPARAPGLQTSSAQWTQTVRRHSTRSRPSRPATRKSAWNRHTPIAIEGRRLRRRPASPIARRAWSGIGVTRVPWVDASEQHDDGYSQCACDGVQHFQSGQSTTALNIAEVTVRDARLACPFREAHAERFAYLADTDAKSYATCVDSCRHGQTITIDGRSNAGVLAYRGPPPPCGVSRLATLRCVRIMGACLTPPRAPQFPRSALPRSAPICLDRRMPHGWQTRRRWYKRLKPSHYGSEGLGFESLQARKTRSRRSAR